MQSRAARHHDEENPLPESGRSDHLNRRASSPRAGEKRKRSSQQRQPLSCSKCRERKVRCDKTKPCTACCQRGHPQACEFNFEEGTQYGPIQQSKELLILRSENIRLKEKLLDAQISIDDDSDDGAPTSSHPKLSTIPSRKFGIDEPTDSLYFGTPSLAKVLADLSRARPTTTDYTSPSFSSDQVSLLSETPTTYPFPTLWTQTSWVHGLGELLKPWEDVSFLLQAYCRGADTTMSPRFATGITRGDMDRFMTDFEHNAVAYPDLLALCFAICATEMQRRVYRDEEPTVNVSRERSRASMYITASKQALRQSSYLSQPTLLSVQAMTLICVFLCNDNRPLDTWTCLGIVIRMAQAIGLHRDPKSLTPLPSLRECTLRKKLWWFLLSVDQQYTKALGRPIGISAMGDCPMPESLTTDLYMLRISECMDQLTVIGRQVVGSAPLTINRIFYYVERLATVSGNLPDAIQFNPSWVEQPEDVLEASAREQSAIFYLHVQAYMALLQRQHVMQLPGQPPAAFPSPANQTSDDMSRRPSDTSMSKARLAMVTACLSVINAFEYLFLRHADVLCDWIIKDEALTACVMLLADWRENPAAPHRPHLERAADMFRSLAEARHDQLAQGAATKLNEGIAQVIADMNQQRFDPNLLSFASTASLGEPVSRRDSTISSALTVVSSVPPMHASGDARSPKSIDTVAAQAMPAPTLPLQTDEHPRHISPTQQRRPSGGQFMQFQLAPTSAAPPAIMSTGTMAPSVANTSPITPMAHHFTTVSHTHQQHHQQGLAQTPTSNPIILQPSGPLTYHHNADFTAPPAVLQPVPAGTPGQSHAGMYDMSTGPAGQARVSHSQMVHPSMQQFSQQMRQTMPPPPNMQQPQHMAVQMQGMPHPLSQQQQQQQQPDQKQMQQMQQQAHARAQAQAQAQAMMYESEPGAQTGPYAAHPGDSF